MLSDRNNVTYMYMFTMREILDLPHYFDLFFVVVVEKVTLEIDRINFTRLFVCIMYHVQINLKTYTLRFMN